MYGAVSEQSERTRQRASGGAGRRPVPTERAGPYADGLTAVVGNLAQGGGGLSHPLLQPREEMRRVAHIVITADRGLAGAYNASVLRAAEGELRQHRSLGREYSLIAVGRKAES